MKYLALGALIGAGMIALSVHADNQGALSYSQVDADNKITGAVSSLQGWAEGEYQEHEAEGLFEKHPAEGRLIRNMIALSQELQAKAVAAKAAGDADKARAYYFSAEATAHYAATMPHLLEERLAQQKR